MIPFRLELLTSNGTLLASSYRSVTLPYRSPLLLVLDTLAFSVPLLVGLRQQVCTLEARCVGLVWVVYRQYCQAAPHAHLCMHACANKPCTLLVHRRASPHATHPARVRRSR